MSHEGKTITLGNVDEKLLEMIDTIVKTIFLKTVDHLFSAWGDFASKGTFGNTTGK